MKVTKAAATTIVNTLGAVDSTVAVVVNLARMGEVASRQALKATIREAIADDKASDKELGVTKEEYAAYVADLNWNDETLAKQVVAA